jgi:hypothetical protein
MISDDYKEILETCVTTIRREFEVSEVPPEKFSEVGKSIALLKMLEKKGAVEVLDVYNLAAGIEARVGAPCQWLAFYTNHTENDFNAVTGQTNQSTYHKCQQLIRVPTSRDFGRVTMRLETTADKFTEIFRSRDVDFSQHKDFSDRYYVLASDEKKLRDSIPDEFLELISRQKLTVEIQGGVISVTKGTEINEKDCLSLITLALKFQQALR